MGRALLLNASFEPLCIVSARRAVVLVLAGKAEVIARQEGEFRSERITVVAPSVIRLATFVRVPHRPCVPLSRRAVFARDQHRCQYCHRAAENIDHVVPRSRGGEHVWENVVASCRQCNARKEDRAPAEVGLRLHRAPVAPPPSLWVLASAGGVDPAWIDYFPAAAAAFGPLAS